MESVSFFRSSGKTERTCLSSLEQNDRKRGSESLSSSWSSLGSTFSTLPSCCSCGGVLPLFPSVHPSRLYLARSTCAAANSAPPGGAALNQRSCFHRALVKVFGVLSFTFLDQPQSKVVVGSGRVKRVKVKCGASGVKRCCSRSSSSCSSASEFPAATVEKL